MIICRYLSKEKLPLLITIIGSMGSGKTTLTRIIHDYCFSDFKLYDLKDIDDVVKIARKMRSPNNKYYLVFDDFSYKLLGRRKQEQEKLNKIFRVRHILNSDEIVLVFVVHYLRSLAVFLRSAQVRILTSISEPEILMYSRDYLFTTSALWDYLHYFSINTNRYIVLYHGLRSGEHILDITIERGEEEEEEKRLV
ncbi:MAG: hypothetical protein QW607_04420 [Desulfurococcaceae archaeon]